MLVGVTWWTSLFDIYSTRDYLLLLDTGSPVPFDNLLRT